MRINIQPMIQNAIVNIPSLHFSNLVNTIYDISLDVELEASIRQALINKVVELFSDSIYTEVVSEEA